MERCPPSPRFQNMATDSLSLFFFSKLITRANEADLQKRKGLTIKKKKEAQLNACPPGSYDVVLKSAGLNHGSFSDVPLLFASGQTKETGDALYNLRSTEAFTRSFLDKYLQHGMGRLLNDASEYPGTIVTRYGR